MLGLWIEQTERAGFWLQVLKDLNKRGVADILIAVTDALQGVPQALSAVFPKTIVRTCIARLLRNSLARVSCKQRRTLAQALKAICHADKAEAGLPAIEAFRRSDLGR